MNIAQRCINGRLGNAALTRFKANAFQPFCKYRDGRLFGHGFCLGLRPCAKICGSEHQKCGDAGKNSHIGAFLSYHFTPYGVAIFVPAQWMRRFYGSVHIA